MSVKTRGGASDKLNNFPLILYEIQKHCLKYQSYFQNILKNYLFLSLLFAFWMIKQCRLVPMLTGHIFGKSRVFSKRQRLFEKHLSCGIWTFTTTERGAQGISANGNREKNGRKNENREKTSGSRQRKLKYCQSEILSLFTVSLRY